MPSEVLMTYEQMFLDRRFTPLTFTVGQTELDAYADVVGVASPSATGLIAIYARQAYLTEGVMPSGGVMAALKVSYRAPLPIGAELRAYAIVSKRAEKKGRGWVTIDIDFSRDDDVFASAQVIGVWPI